MNGILALAVFAARFISPLPTGVRLESAGAAPDRIDDRQFNTVLWLMMKGDARRPSAASHAPLQLLQLTR